jgi:nucleoside-diphosphate-sugar epimerase
VQADVARDDLRPIVRGADAVVHLAWLIQPSRDQGVLVRTNVGGSERIFSAVAEERVPALVYSSSVGAYSRGPRETRVDERWPTEGIASSYYSRQKSAVERRLDRLEREHPGLRVARMRPALVFKREAATGIRRLFVGPFLPGFLLERSLLPVVPFVHGLRFQCVHSHDVGDAFARAVRSSARGAFNVAAEPVLAAAAVGSVFDARVVPVPAGLARSAVAAAWRARLTSISPDWLDLGLDVPLLDTTRAQTELGWTPTVSARDALAELVAGLRDGADAPTPPLATGTSGPLRVNELATGVGARDTPDGG